MWGRVAKRIQTQPGQQVMALPHLIFLTILFVAGLVAWAIDVDRADTPLLVASTVIAGLGSGSFLSAWVLS